MRNNSVRSAEVAEKSRLRAQLAVSVRLACLTRFSIIISTQLPVKYGLQCLDILLLATCLDHFSAARRASPIPERSRAFSQLSGRREPVPAKTVGFLPGARSEAAPTDGRCADLIGALVAMV